MKQLCLCLILIIFRFSILLPQWIHYTSENTSGIAGEVITSIISANHNIIWFGTNKGIVKFDRENRLWETIDISDGLSGDFIYQVFIDINGSFWAATNGGGVVHYENDKWRSYTIRNGLSSNFIRSIAQTPDGTIWFGTYGKGLNKYNLSSGFSKTDIPELNSSKILSLLPVNDSALLIGTSDHGLFRYNNPGLDCLNEESGLVSNHIQCIYKTQEGIILIGTDKGAQLIDIENWESGSGFPGLNGRTIYSICEGEDGIMLFGSKDSIYHIHENILTKMSPDETDTGTIYLALHFEPSGDLWCGTSTKGAYCYDGHSWSHYYQSTGLTQYYFNSICQDKQGKMWFSSYQGLGCFNGSNWSFVNLDNTTYFNDLLTDHDGNIWVQAYDQVRKYDGLNWTIYSASNVQNLYALTCMAIDHSGNIWAGTEYSGIFRFDGNRWKQYTMIDGLKSDNIKSIDTDSQGAIWAVSWEGYISRYHNFWSRDVPSMVPDMYPIDLKVDSDNNIWIAGYRLLKISGDKQKWFFNDSWGSVSIETDPDKNLIAAVNRMLYHFADDTFNEICGIEEDYINKIFFDKNNFIWLATYNGIYRSETALDLYNEPDPLNEKVCIHPNPFIDGLHILLNEESSEDAEIAFYALDGRWLYSFYSRISGNEIQLNTDILPKGMMICRIHINGNIYSEKIFKY